MEGTARAKALRQKFPTFHKVLLLLSHFSRVQLCETVQPSPHKKDTEHRLGGKCTITGRGAGSHPFCEDRSLSPPGGHSGSSMKKVGRPVGWILKDKLKLGREFPVEGSAKAEVWGYRRAQRGW